MKPCVLITGGTGLVGNALTKALLGKGYEVIILSRKLVSPESATPGLFYACWDPASGKADVEAFAKADHIINLAGAGVADQRWTAKRKALIRDSRVQAGQLITSLLANNSNKVQSVINASAIGWYGPDKNPASNDEKGFSETDPPANDFLGTTCQDWEHSIKGVETLGKRLVILRTGIVLSTKGGALKEFLKPLRFRIAAVLGSGRQVISWIHMDDLVDLFIYMIENRSQAGVFNAIGPNPVSNRTLVKELARQQKPGFHLTIPVPAFMLRIILGEMSIEVLKSARVSCRKILEAGFQFRHPELPEALRNLLHEQNFPD
ncbi:MAG: TIGR01777 family protein [Chitinophagaceae bacterium]|nr:TIGR01777 family protein [Chitinophagaceae bacterium]